MILATAILFFVIAFRSYNVGLDTKVYAHYFELMKGRPRYAAVLGWEPLYMAVNWLGTKIGGFQLVLIICALITCVGFSYFAYKNTDDQTSIFWYFFFFITFNLYFNSMHLIRQMCAVAIGINVYTVFRNGLCVKTYVKAAVLIILGSCFHISALMCVVMALPFMIKNLNRRKILWLVALALVGIALISVGQEIVLKLVPRFTKYMSDDRLSEGHAGFLSYVMIVLKIVMIAFSLKLDSRKPENKELYRLTFMIVISTAFYIMQFRTQFALRLGYFFEAFMPLYIPAFVRKLKDRSSRLLAYFFLFLFGLAYFTYMIAFGTIKSNRGCVPYTFFWQ